ncbi:MAG: hypothetical protein OCU22_07760 [Canidatus Methanoxibalbensis ujae]|nr:hypothetical protein [Candidatus Methanoxibalbensis ujae]
MIFDEPATIEFLEGYSSIYGLMNEIASVYGGFAFILAHAARAIDRSIVISESLKDKTKLIAWGSVKSEEDIDEDITMRTVESHSIESINKVDDALSFITVESKSIESTDRVKHELVMQYISAQHISIIDKVKDTTSYEYVAPQSIGIIDKIKDTTTSSVEILIKMRGTSYIDDEYSYRYIVHGHIYQEEYLRDGASLSGLKDKHEIFDEIRIRTVHECEKELELPYMSLSMYETLLLEEELPSYKVGFHIYGEGHISDWCRLSYTHPVYDEVMSEIKLDVLGEYSTCVDNVSDESVNVEIVHGYVDMKVKLRDGASISGFKDKHEIFDEIKVKTEADIKREVELPYMSLSMSECVLMEEELPSYKVGFHIYGEGYIRDESEIETGGE